MNAWRRVWVLLVSVSLLLATTVVFAADGPVTVKCRLKMKYRVHTENPTVDAVNQYLCNATIVATSDVDAVDLTARQVVFDLANCPRLPSTVVFADRGVTEVRELRGHRIKAHVFAGECAGCVMSVSSAVADPRLDAGHFDAVFLVRPLSNAVDVASLMLPSGKGHLTLRSERTDDKIVRAGWTARKCEVVPRPPIFCGGIAGIPCPGGMSCVDWPEDDCDPDAGHADCIGICVDGGS